MSFERDMKIIARYISDCDDYTKACFFCPFFKFLEEELDTVRHQAEEEKSHNNNEQTIEEYKKYEDLLLTIFHNTRYKGKIPKYEPQI